jgi:hypothetical protein
VDFSFPLIPNGDPKSALGTPAKLGEPINIRVTSPASDASRRTEPALQLKNKRELLSSWVALLPETSPTLNSGASDNLENKKASGYATVHCADAASSFF